MSSVLGVSRSELRVSVAAAGTHGGDVMMQLPPSGIRTNEDSSAGLEMELAVRGLEHASLTIMVELAKG